MPTVALFYGIAIRMYFKDHAPPHFHAIYEADEAFVSIETGEIVYGSLPESAARLVKEWAIARQVELRENWARTQAMIPLEKIPGPDNE